MAAQLELDALTGWIADRLGAPGGVRLDGLDRVDTGHSAEMLTFSVTDLASGERQDVVLKLRPPSPGLLEPYELARQFEILRALAATPVRSPAALWFEGTGAVLGREFYVMERVGGQAYERVVPPELDEPGVIPAMCDSLVDELAVIHAVDVEAVGLSHLGDPRTFVDRELDRWSGDMRRVQRGPLPALERLLAELVAQRPAASGRVALVHGDSKPGNFGFVGTEVSAVFDWEMTDVGDPMADIGYLELMWDFPVGITSRPTAPAFDGALARWEAASGFTATDRSWWRALEAYKTAVILLMGSMLFEAGHSDDMRYLEMGLGIDFITQTGLAALGVEESLDAGSVLPSDERIAQVQRQKEG